MIKSRMLVKAILAFTSILNQTRNMPKLLLKSFWGLSKKNEGFIEIQESIPEIKSQEKEIRQEIA